MDTEQEQVTLIIGIDPSTAKGKPMAIALVAFAADGERRLVRYYDQPVTARHIHDRMDDWLLELRKMLYSCHELLDREADMVVIEDARARGRGGANMQYLVNMLKVEVETQGMRCERVNPLTVKKHATGHGHAETEVVATIVRSEYNGMEEVPIVASVYDVEMAVAIAGCGYAMLQKEQLVDAEEVRSFTKIHSERRRPGEPEASSCTM